MYTCRECGGRLILNEDNTYVCEVCGLVHDPPIQYSGDVFERKISGPVPWDGLEEGSFIGRSIGGWRIARANLYVKMSSRRVMEMHALRCIKSVSQRLGIPSHVEKRAEMIYLQLSRKVSEERAKLLGPRRKLNHYRLAAVAILLACREYGINVKSKTVIREFRAEGHNVTVSNMIEGFWLARRVGLCPRRSTISELVSLHIRTLKRRYGRKLAFILDDVRPIAFKIAKRVEGHPLIQGKNPSVVASAVLYVALNSLAVPTSCYAYLTLSELARALGHSPSSIRSSIDSIKRIIEVEDYEEIKNISENRIFTSSKRNGNNQLSRVASFTTT